MENRIKLKLGEIAQCVTDSITNIDDKEGLDGLYGVEFGNLLFLNYFQQYSKDSKLEELIDLYTDKLLNKFTTRGTNIHTFSSGIAGILYLFEYLKINTFLEVDISDTESVFENYLLRKMREDIDSNHYDFLHGALGVGLYFLKIDKKEPIYELVDYLQKTAIKDYSGTIYKWESILDRKTGEKGFNISLSHGISSIIIFLSRLIKNGINNDLILEMLNGAVNYVLSQQTKNEISYFPAGNTNEPRVSRLAWCYGDLGVAYAIWHAGKTVKNSEWERIGLTILMKSTSRISLSENGVVDAGLCHGSAGIAMIYRRMYINTKHHVFQAAAKYWVEQTLSFARFDNGLAGYKSFMLNTWHKDYSFLTGISGIGTMLISYVSNDNQVWDELLLLS